MVGNWCAAINCKVNKKAFPHASFFTFPKDPERCQQWIKNSRRDDLVGLSPKAKCVYRRYYLCPKHFEDSQFMNAEVKNKLVWNAIPTIFDIPNPPKQLTVKRQRLRQHLNEPRKTTSPCIRDSHICGRCGLQFRSLDDFISHKVHVEGCRLVYGPSVNNSSINVPYLLPLLERKPSDQGNGAAKVELLEKSKTADTANKSSQTT